MRQALVAVALLLALTDEQREEIRAVSEDLTQLDRLHEEQQALCRRVDRELSRLGDGCNEPGTHLTERCIALHRPRSRWAVRCER